MNTKKILGVVAVLALVAVAFVGAGAAATEVNNETDLIAAIGTDNFDVILTDNITLSQPLTIEKQGTLDLGGHILSVVGTDNGVVNVKATTSETTSYEPVCITNGTIGGEDIYWGLRVYGTNANEDLKDYELVVDHLYDDNTIVYVKLSNLNIYGSVFGLLGNGASHGTYIDAEDCNIKAFDTTDSIGIYHPQSGVLNLTNCTVEGYSTAVEVRAGCVNAFTCTLISTCPDYECVANGSGTTTMGATVAMDQHTTNLKSRLWLSHSTISTASGIDVALANKQNATSESVIEIGSMNVNVYVDDDDGNIDMTFKVGATSSQGIDDCVLNFMNKKWEEIKDSVIYGGAGCVITTMDSTKRFSTKYDNVEGDSPVSVDECVDEVTEEGGSTVVNASVALKYKAYIPSGVTLGSSAVSADYNVIIVSPSYTAENNVVLRYVSSAHSQFVTLDNEDQTEDAKKMQYGLSLTNTTPAVTDVLAAGTAIVTRADNDTSTGAVTLYYGAVDTAGKIVGTYNDTLTFSVNVEEIE